MLKTLMPLFLLLATDAQQQQQVLVGQECNSANDATVPGDAGGICASDDEPDFLHPEAGGGRRIAKSESSVTQIELEKGYIAARGLFESLATVVDVAGNTALMFAAEDGHAPMVKALLADTRVNPVIANQGGNTALMFAAQNGHSPVVALLLSDDRVDAAVANRYGFTALMFASMKGHAPVAKLLLADTHVDPAIPDHSGNTPLILAAEGGHAPMVTLLLADARVDPSIVNHGGNTPLMFASQHGHSPVVTLLLADTRVDPAIANKEGNTALMFAAQHGYLPLVALLLADGRVDPAIANRKHFTALMYAIQYGHTEIMDVLLQRTMKIDDITADDLHSGSKPLIDLPALRTNTCNTAAECLVPLPTHIERTFVDVVQIGGRTGHKMKDYLTGIVLHFLADYKLVFTNSWVFPKDDHQNHAGIFNLVDPCIFRDLSETRDVVYVDHADSNSAGMAYEEFKDIVTRVEETKMQHPRQHVVLRMKNRQPGAPRILLSDVYNWEARRYIPSGTYQRITDYVKTRFYELNERIVSRSTFGEIDIAVHIRKGDVHLFPLHTSVKYYQNVIEQLKTIRGKKTITIYSERWAGYDEIDVYALRELMDPLTTINVVFDVCLYEYFSDMLSKRIFVPTLGHGSFSDMLLNYKERGTLVIVNHDERQSKYDDDMGGTLFKTDANGQFNVTRLQQKLNQKTIWMYWEQGGERPGHIAQCVRAWKQLNPSWTVQLLDYAAAVELVPIMRTLSELSVQLRSDVIRLSLLEKFGGVWVDVTVYPQAPLDAWLGDELLQSEGFFVFKFMTHSSEFEEGRTASTWFIATDGPSNYVVSTWLHAFVAKIRAGIRSCETNPDCEAPYFVCHYALTELVQRDAKIAGVIHRLHLSNEGAHACAPNATVWKLSLRRNLESRCREAVARLAAAGDGGNGSEQH